jgi:hypothetical protein
MDSTTKLSHDILLELLSLRNKKDIDLFMDKLYESLIGEITGVLDPESMTIEHRLALSLMIQHFLSKEEYEKCAALQKMICKETSYKHC